jgi:hypothetical protein
MTELEELQSLLAQPLPGGRGFQKKRQERIAYLHNKVVDELITNIVDVNGARDLAVMWLEEVTGMDVDLPRICENKEFKEIWADYFPEDDDTLPSESPSARHGGDKFEPNTELYGQPISIIDANEDSDVPKVGTLKEIISPHAFRVEMGGVVQDWEVDSANDFQINDGKLTLWNAWR